MTIGRLLYIKRLLLQMNQVEAATLLGVESDTLKKWERGKELPDDSYLPRIKKFLDRNLVGSDLSMKAYRK